MSTYFCPSHSLPLFPFFTSLVYSFLFPSLLISCLCLLQAPLPGSGCHDSWGMKVRSRVSGTGSAGGGEGEEGTFLAHALGVCGGKGESPASSLGS